MMGEPAAARILQTAIDEGRAVEFLDVLWAGGSATVDPNGRLVLIDGDQLAQMFGDDNVAGDMAEGAAQSIFSEIRQLQREVAALSDAQSQINADVAALQAANNTIQTALTDISNQLTSIQADIAALQAANPALDLSGLAAAVTAAQGTATSATTVDTTAQADAAADAPPAPPAPAPAPVAEEAPAEDPPVEG